ncbi:MAG TPA: tRNA-binding protein [Chloroflexia bacterium]|nr:tRNA-binding protein [Chloroflexia bacterium]
MEDAHDRAPETITIDVFDRVDMRAGRITRVDPFPEARKPSYKLEIDFGPLGTRKSSAQLTAHYTPEELVGKMVVAVVNFPPRRIAGFASEVLVLGLPDAGVAREGGVILLAPEREVEPGARVF